MFSYKETHNERSIKTKNNISLSIDDNNNINNRIQQSIKPQITYDDIFNKINLHIQEQITKKQIETNRNTNTNTNTNTNNNNNRNLLKEQFQNNKNIQSYQQSINNKNIQSYQGSINNEPIILKPKNIEEYRQMVIAQMIINHNRKVHISNIKSKKLIMPIQNINIRPKQIHNYSFNLMG